MAWNGDVLSLEQLETRFNEAGQAERQPTIVLKADKESRYDTVAQVMSRASGAGLTDIAFATDNWFFQDQKERPEMVAFFMTILLYFNSSTNLARSLLSFGGMAKLQ